VNRPTAVRGDSVDSDASGEANQKALNEEEITDDQDDAVPSKTLRRPDDVSLVPVAVPAAMAKSPRIVPPVGAGPSVARKAANHKSAKSASRATVVRSAPRKPWVIPTAIVGALAVIIAILIGINHHENGTEPSTVRIGSTSIVPTAPAQQPGITP